MTTVAAQHLGFQDDGSNDSSVRTRSFSRRTVSMTKCQSLSTFSSENLSVSDGEEGNTTDHSHSGTPDVVSTNTDERLDDKSDDLLSQGSEIPADPSDLTQLGSDGLSEKEAILQRVKSQLTTNDHNYEVYTVYTYVKVHRHSEKQSSPTDFKSYTAIANNF